MLFEPSLPYWRCAVRAVLSVPLRPCCPCRTVATRGCRSLRQGLWGGFTGTAPGRLRAAGPVSPAQQPLRSAISRRLSSTTTQSATISSRLCCQLSVGQTTQFHDDYINQPSVFNTYCFHYPTSDGTLRFHCCFNVSRLLGVSPCSVFIIRYSQFTC